ncbi:hypothetical protein SAMN05421879_10134 [Ornithinimicrobium cerasi]|uniref:Uncharacterized protein n=2 Tax=Ornithinimicrobium cerasi TaxID=2248773 RepID=A0A285VAK7_9MICO|nr:hypothetical protein SAMN05421879_10134 [Ornithinimicrobium cerasi]
MDRADLLARRLLYDAPERDGRAMVRAWGEVVEGAADLWAHLPRRSDLPGTGQEIITQLARTAKTLHRSAGQARQVDPTLQEIGTLFTRAAAMIEASGTGRPGTRWTHRQNQDAFAARLNIMHTLYVTSHAVSVALATTARDEIRDSRLQVYNVPAHELRARVLDVEQIAHSYLRGHHPTGLDGRHRQPVDDTRIDTAIATWDVHAQRTLTREPTPDAMAHVAGAAFATTLHAHRLWRAAAHTGHVDPRTYRKEITPALEAMIERWGQANTVWHNLHHPQVASANVLREASWELVNAMLEVTRDRIGAATGQRIAERVDMPTVLRSLHRVHATLASVGDLFHDTARRAPFVVNARPANDLAHQLEPPTAKRRGWPGLEPEEQSVLSARDVLLRRAVPLPEPLRPLLERPSAQAAVASRAALRATIDVGRANTDAMHVPTTWTKTNPPAARLARSQHAERQRPAPTPGIGVASAPGR